MKNSLIRAFVLSLTVAGFGAATVASHARTMNLAKTANVSLLPGSQPMCVPSTGETCGLE